MRLLIVEDYEPLRESLSRGLRAEGYAVDAAADGEEGWWFLNSNDYDVAIIDRMLPQIDGIELVRRLRRTEKSTPVLMLTARDAIEDRVEGLDAGADDYLSKPFAVTELLARLRSLVRRGHGQSTPMLELETLRLDPSAKTVHRDERLIQLSPREYQLLEFLLHRQGAVVSRTELWEHLYDFEQDTVSNVLDVLVGRVRRKIQQDGEPELIHTRRGQGYIAAIQA